MTPFHQILGNNLVANITNFTVWFAITFWVYLETHSVFATGTIAGLYLVFTAGFGIWLGSIVDHNAKKLVMLGSSVVSFGFYAVSLGILLLNPAEAFTVPYGLTLWLFVLPVMLEELLVVPVPPAPPMPPSIVSSQPPGLAHIAGSIVADAQTPPSTHVKPSLHGTPMHARRIMIGSDSGVCGTKPSARRAVMKPRAPFTSVGRETFARESSAETPTPVTILIAKLELRSFSGTTTMLPMRPPSQVLVTTRAPFSSTSSVVPTTIAVPSRSAHATFVVRTAVTSVGDKHPTKAMIAPAKTARRVRVHIRSSERDVGVRVKSPSSPPATCCRTARPGRARRRGRRACAGDRRTTASACASSWTRGTACPRGTSRRS